MHKKTDRITAMNNIINQAKDELPLYDSGTFLCGTKGSFNGCHKKRLELVESELSYWDY